MQALDRSQPVPPMMPGMPERRSHDYARHSTTSLFAAFNIADGTVISELHRRHRAADYLVLVAAALTGNLIKAGVARPPTGTAGTGSLAGTVSFRDPNITDVGGHGAGYLAKLLVNVLWFGQAIATVESLLARRAGMDLDVLRQALTDSAASSAFIRDSLGALLAGDHMTGFGLDRCCEELAAATALGRDHEVPFELSARGADPPACPDPVRPSGRGAPRRSAAGRTSRDPAAPRLSVKPGDTHDRRDAPARPNPPPRRGAVRRRPASRGRPGTLPGTSAPRPRWRRAESGGPPRSAPAACGSAAGRRPHAGCRRARRRGGPRRPAPRAPAGQDLEGVQVIRPFHDLQRQLRLERDRIPGTSRVSGAAPG